MARRKSPPAEIAIVRDERTRQQERYRIYELLTPDKPGEELSCIAATPNLEGIGITLSQLRKEEQIKHTSRIGILDDVEGTWLINPYAKGARK